jgi:hypothetical protein
MIAKLVPIASSTNARDLFSSTDHRDRLVHKIRTYMNIRRLHD